MKLNDRHIRFCEIYLTCQNAKQAYLEAGFDTGSERTAETGSSKLLNRPEIQQYLHERRQSLRDTTDATLQKTVERLESISAANLADFMTWENDQVTIVESAKLTREQTYAIKRRKPASAPLWAVMAML